MRSLDSCSENRPLEVSVPTLCRVGLLGSPEESAQTGWLPASGASTGWRLLVPGPPAWMGAEPCLTRLPTGTARGWVTEGSVVCLSAWERAL